MERNTEMLAIMASALSPGILATTSDHTLSTIARKSMDLAVAIHDEAVSRQGPAAEPPADPPAPPADPPTDGH